MTCQSLLGVGEGLAAGVGEGFAEDLDFEDFDFARPRGARQRQRTPAISRERNRGAFIVSKSMIYADSVRRVETMTAQIKTPCPEIDHSRASLRLIQPENVEKRVGD